MNNQNPLVSVIIPCRNEISYIESCIRSILQQEPPRGGFEVIVADGMSDDGTRELLEKLTQSNSILRVISNPGRIVPTGLNAAIREARGDIIIRMDAHTEYAPDYIQQCVAVLNRTGADNVGGPARTKATSYMQQAICVAYHHPLSCGGAQFHNVNFEGYVDTVTYGCWRKETLLKLGLFDEELVRNQDDELNLRITRSGGKIWQSPEIQSWYYPRASLKALFRQYAQYGYWKVRVLQKHKIPASIRHLVPGAFVSSLAALALLSIWVVSARWLLLGISSVYLTAIVLASIHACILSKSFRLLPVLPIIFATYHFSYGYGFMRGLIDFWFSRNKKDSSFTQLTRSQHSSPPVSSAEKAT